MDWVMALVVVSGIIAVTTLVIHLFPQKELPDAEELIELRAKQEVFVAEREVFKKEIIMWTERGDRLNNAYNDNKKSLDDLHKTLADLVKNVGEKALLKDFVAKFHTGYPPAEGK